MPRVERPATGAMIVLSALTALAGCFAHVTGSVAVDGVPFVAVDCRSGAAYGGWGVELSDTAGRRLRVGANLDGALGVALFQPGATNGDYLGSCGAIAVQAQHSRVDGIVNVEGAATLSCQAHGHRISGQVSFENCH
jgi:hypothetical protein